MKKRGETYKSIPNESMTLQRKRHKQQKHTDRNVFDCRDLYTYEIFMSVIFGPIPMVHNRQYTCSMLNILHWHEILAPLRHLFDGTQSSLLLKGFVGIHDQINGANFSRHIYMIYSDSCFRHAIYSNGPKNKVRRAFLTHSELF